MKLLIAEDDPMTLHLLKAVLSNSGYEIHTVRDGKAALAALQAPDGPRLAIIDWMMPGLDGPDVCRRFRDTNPDIYAYFILLTGRESKADLVAGLKSGASDYLTKPFDHKVSRFIAILSI